MIGNPCEINIQHNSAIGALDCVPIIPPIPSGTGSWERLGDRVQPKSLKLRGVVSLTKGEGYLGEGDLYVRIMVISQKNLKTATQVAGAQVAVNSLLRPNFPTLRETNYGGNTNDTNLPINTELFRVYYDKVHRLTGAPPDNASELTRYSSRWSYTFKELPASLTFDETNGDYCNNFAPFVAIGYAYSDGTAPDSVATRITSHYTSFLSFEDA